MRNGEGALLCGEHALHAQTKRLVPGAAESKSRCEAEVRQSICRSFEEGRLGQLGPGWQVDPIQNVRGPAASHRRTYSGHSDRFHRKFLFVILKQNLRSHYTTI